MNPSKIAAEAAQEVRETTGLLYIWSNERIAEPIERALTTATAEAQARISDLEAARKLLESAHPARVWDMARQYYTAGDTEDGMIVSWHKDKCDQVTTALSTQPETETAKGQK